MKGKRTGIEFGEHEVLVTKTEECLIHYLKKPNTISDSIKYINVGGILAVTGDYGNWIFVENFILQKMVMFQMDIGTKSLKY
jgi:hypothetical protein